MSRITLLISRALALMAALGASAVHCQPVDKSRYPALDGQWVRNVGAQDPRVLIEIEAIAVIPS